MKHVLQTILTITIAMAALVPNASSVYGKTGMSVPRSYAEGRAAYYGSRYTHEKWVRIYNIHVKEQRVAKNPLPPSSHGYHCVHADIDLVGVPLTVRANGISITCVTADMVKKEHKSAWRKRWAIELSWTAFRALGLEKNNRVVVYRP